MSRHVPRHAVVLTAVLALLLGSGLAVAAAASTGAISGTVSVASGSPSAACVSAYDRGGARYGEDQVDDLGGYEITGLQTGSYRVKFAPCSGNLLATQWYAGAADLLAAAPVAVTDGLVTTGIDAAMTLTGTVAGTVTGEAGAPLSGVCVRIPGSGTADIRTGALGTYSIGGLAPGGHDLVVGACSYDASEYATSTTLVTVAEGETTTADVALQRKGEIAGTVKDEAGAPIAGICVTAARGYQHGSSSKTDVTGAYRLRGLDDGDYAVRYDDCSGGAYSTEWWQDAARQQDATLVSTSVGTTATADAQLQAGGRVTGRLKLAGKDVYPACVEVWRAGEELAQTSTSVDGSFATPALAAATYTLRFGCGEGFLSQWHGRTQSPAAAAPVVVGTGNTALGDISLVQGGSITGTLTSGGKPASGVCVSASSPTSGDRTSTAADGTYRLTGLWPGSYTVRLADCGEAFLSKELTGITVTDSGTTVADGVLSQGGRITGRVADDTGAPVPGACVNAQGPSFRSDQTDAAGNYELVLGAAGDYTLYVYPCEGDGFVREFFEDQRELSTAKRLSVATDQVVSGVDVQVQRTATLTGRVVSDAGDAVADACIRAHSDLAYGSTSTDESGAYRLTGLTPGTYAVQISGCDRNDPVTEWFPDAGEMRDAQPVELAPGETKGLADAIVTRASSLSGTVTRAHDGAPAAGACVQATDRHGAELGDAITALNGSYRIGGLVAGSYRVRVGDCYDGRYVTEWFGDAANLETAAPVELGSAAQRSGVDMVVAARGRVTGRITDGSGLGIAGICVSATEASGQKRALGTTSISGRYASSYLDTGDYAVGFEDCSSPLTYQDEWFDNATSAASAQAVTVLPAADVPVDAVLGERTATPTTGSGPTETPTTAPTTTAPSTPAASSPTGGGGSAGFPPASPSAPPAAPTPTPTPTVPTPTPVTPTPTAPPVASPTAPVDGGELPAAGEQVEVPLQQGTPDDPSAVQIGPLTVYNTGDQAGLTVEQTTLDGGAVTDVTVLGPVLDISPANDVADDQLVVCLEPDLSAYPEGSPFREAAALWHLTPDGELVNESAAYHGALAPEGAVCGAPDSFSPFFAGALPTATDVADACAGVSSAGFSDVAADSVHRSAIDCAAWWNLTLGVTPTTYGPAWQVTRAQMASFLTRLAVRAGAELPAGPDAFADDRDSVHEQSINRLAAAGIVRGAAAGQYEPDAVVSRAQMASFLVRTYEHVAGTALAGGSHPFVDAGVPPHDVAIAKAVAAGFTNGRTATTYAPSEPVRRDQMASFLTRVLQKASAQQ